MSETESPGRGHGISKPGGPKFNSVLDALKGQKDKANNTSQDHLVGITPSKKLPSTGLKRNTEEWKEAHPDEGKTRSRASSSSSIPSLARGGEDDRTAEEKANGQEGPRGRGPGQHEKEVKVNGDQRDGEGGRDIVDSPSSEYSHNGLQFPSPPNGAPPTGTNMRSAEAPVGSEARAVVEGGEGGPKKPEKKASETYEGRDSERERKLTDEAGRRPGGMPAVKREEAPGPRNEIVLDPRISHMHVSLIIITHTEAELIHPVPPEGRIHT